MEYEFYDEAYGQIEDATINFLDENNKEVATITYNLQISFDINFEEIYAHEQAILDMTGDFTFDNFRSYVDDVMAMFSDVVYYSYDVCDIYRLYNNWKANKEKNNR